MADYLGKKLDLMGGVAFGVAAITLAVALFPEFVPTIQIEVRIIAFLVGLLATGYLLTRERSTTEQMRITTDEMKNAIQKISSEFTVKQIFDFLRKKKCVYYAVYIEAKKEKKRVMDALDGQKFYPINLFDHASKKKTDKGLPEKATWQYIRIQDVPDLEKLDEFKVRVEGRGVKILSCYLIDLVSHVAKDNKFYNKVLAITEENAELKKAIVERIVLERKVDLLEMHSTLKGQK